MAMTGDVRADAFGERSRLPHHGSGDCSRRDRGQERDAQHTTVDHRRAPGSTSTRGSIGTRPRTVMSFQPPRAMRTPIDTTIHPPVDW